ncbi:AAA family ATPase [Microbacterium sp.]|uniref:AAA family ATPase n=1 Tax=Microbacterium sp. TaxID=51671 RepID=UPI003734EC38
MANRISMADLMVMKFKPVEYVIPGIVPEGLTILAAPPKIGKSWLVLDLAYQLAVAGKALGAVPIDRERPVLYMALEDTPRRLQDRLNMLEVTEYPSNLYLQTSVDAGDVLREASAFMAERADDAPVVIIDTLGKIAPPASAGESDYQRDYRVGGGLKAVADSVTGGAVIVVHHTRKAQGDDFLDSVSGTQGLAGSADSILVLRRERNDASGSLSVTSRDAAEGEYAVNKVGARWVLAAGTLTAAAIALANKRITAGLGSNSAAIIEYVNAHPEGTRAADVAEALEISEKDAGTYLLRAFRSERIERFERGLYGPVGTVGSVGNGDNVPTDPTLPTHTYGGVWDDPGTCTHGVTVGARCSKCGGTAS